MGAVEKFARRAWRELRGFSRGQFGVLGGFGGFGGFTPINLQGENAGQLQIKAGPVLNLSVAALGGLNFLGSGGGVGTGIPIKTPPPITTPGPPITGPIGPVVAQPPPPGPPPPSAPPPGAPPPQPIPPGAPPPVFSFQPMTAVVSVARRAVDCIELCAPARFAGPEAYIACTAACAGGPQIAQAGQRLISLGRNIVDQFTAKNVPPGPPPLARQPQQQQSQPREVRTLDQKTPCPSCDRLGQQRAQLQQEIETEQSQQLDQQVADTQRQLDQLAQLEQQPAELRNIPQELAQKQMLLDRINQQLGQLGQPAQQQLTRPAGGEVPTLDQPAGEQAAQDRQAAQQLAQRAQLEMPQTITLPTGESRTLLPKSGQGVTFCVGCQSEEDAILFLNGEPSECSVIPGSTKPLQLGA